jgi:hypothetical protein
MTIIELLETQSALVEALKAAIAALEQEDGKTWLTLDQCRAAVASAEGN